MGQNRAGELTGDLSYSLVMPSIALPGYQWNPPWAPDGSVIASRQSFGPSSHLYTVRAGGTGLRLRPPDPAWGGAIGPTWMRRR